MKKNQKKEFSEPQADKDRKTAKADEKEIEKEDTKEESANDSQETAAQGDTCNDESGKTAEGDGKEKKEATETDLLKFYLSKSMKDLKEQKDKNEDLDKRNGIMKSQIEQCKDKYDRLVSEYENYRRRTAEEKAKIGGDAVAKAVLALLPALDNLERAMPFAQSNHESFVKGVEMTLRQMSEAFKSLGVEEIEAQDKVFDPNLHDAVMHVDDDSLGESVITQVFQKGYKIGDKVVRHSVVKVAN